MLGSDKVKEGPGKNPRAPASGPDRMGRTNPVIPAFAAQPSCRSTASTLRKSLFLLCPVLLTAALWGQQAQELLEKAPPEVDDALRARVTKFYQAMVDGKFRAAYDLAW